MRRVIVTGMAGISSIGQNWETVEQRLRARQNGIVCMPEWHRFDNMNTRLAGPVSDFTIPPHYSRKKIRSMGRVSLLSTRASELALEDAGLLGDPVLRSGRTGIAYGSSTGSPDAVEGFCDMLKHGHMAGIAATSYIQMMGHTTPVNVGLFFGLKGRMIPTSSACTSAGLAIGYAYETIKYGKQDIMVAGGAEELCPTEAAVFDKLYATSTMNDRPSATPRPFDVDRDGLVIGEGAATIILEEYEHAEARGAKMHAEIVGFGTNTDGRHITQPTSSTMKTAMDLALQDAALSPRDIGYVNAHGTATDQGDIAESQATAAVFGPDMPISSLKSYIGHTLGACAALEAWMSVEMMNRDWYAPTINLERVDERCTTLDYIVGEGRSMHNQYIMTNNFAFGGINTSLIFKRLA
jgi:3-oxoacyl-[acyl-carrier-protein] synthase II